MTMVMYQDEFFNNGDNMNFEIPLNIYNYI